MSTRKDPLADMLVRPEGPDRVFYALGTLLADEDFTDEQTYHRGRLARALAYLHGTGTAAGLRVSYAADKDEIVVEPGIALDALGRIVEVPRDACLRVDRWLDRMRSHEALALGDAFDVDAGTITASLFVRFVAADRGKTPVAASGPFDATSAVAPSRVRDAYELKLFLEGTAPASFEPIAPDLDESADPELDLKDAILEAWSRDAMTEPSWVLLAQVSVPAAESATAGDPPIRADGVLSIDNYVRPFVYPAWALARRAGLRAHRKKIVP